MKVSAPAEIRGMLGEFGDSPDWLEEMAKFPNGVPRFANRDDALAFMEEYNTYHGGSNPDHPQLMHVFTMLISWEQIEKYLIPNIHKAREEPSFQEHVPRNYLAKYTTDSTTSNCSSAAIEDNLDSNSCGTRQNVYECKEAFNVVRDVNFRLDLPFHRCLNPVSTINTLKYLFYHMKCGIYVMIRNRKLHIFAPFVNSNYRNTWGDRITLEGDGSLDTYYTRKAGLYREENVEKDKYKWWANGNIICNEISKSENMESMQFWGDQFLTPLRDMLGEACRTRNMPDCEFFINKRDYPQLKVNVPRGEPVEPYGFIFDKDDRIPEEDVDLSRCKFKTYAPIVSFYAAAPDRFADIPWPSSEDWEAACGEVFPHTFMHKKDSSGKAVFDSNPRDLFTEANFRKFEKTWDDESRVPTAFFRGTATGGGTTIESNQRLMVAHLAHCWKDDPEKGGKIPFLDAAIVGWNMRDKKIASGPMTFLRSNEFGFTAGKHHFTPIYEQSKYKYLVYVDGHCAACRYGFMMRLGSVILKVAPRQVADTMWYFPLLKPYVDHVPVKADLSDLEEKIRWCRENDETCRQIAENAKEFYSKYVGRSALLDYVEMICKSISRRYVQPPQWWSPPPKEEPAPHLRRPDMPCHHQAGKSRLCVRCQEAAESEERAFQEMRAQERNSKKDQKLTKAFIRNRMKREAESKSSTITEGQAKRTKMT